MNIRAAAPPKVARMSGAMIVRFVRIQPAPQTRDASRYVSPRAIIPESCIRVENGSISVM